MANWTLTCKRCSRAFKHSQIKDTLENYFMPAKPDVPAGGAECECPHCGAKFRYQKDDLTYQFARRTGQ